MNGCPITFSHETFSNGPTPDHREAERLRIERQAREEKAAERISKIKI